MVKFNNEINQSIKELMKLRALPSKEQYLEKKENIIKKYGVSARTVEMWLRQRTPGLRKVRSDAGHNRVKITQKEKRIVSELMKSGKRIKDIKKITENKTTKKMSNRKLNKIRRNEASKITDETEKKTEESNFGDKAKELFEELFELDLIAPDAGVKIKVKGTNFIVRKEYLEDICMILANAYNNAVELKYKVDRNEMLRMKIMNLIEQQVRLAMNGLVDTKSIEAITRMFDRLNENVEMDVNIRTVEKVCKELKKDITLSEIISLLKKHSENG